MTTRTRPPDHYATLGVPPDATTAQIKKAYRKLARQHHPDTNPGDPGAATRFKTITEAYEVLTDPARRRPTTRPGPRSPPPRSPPRTRWPGHQRRRATSWKTSGR